jgi:hypothetical protein
MKRLSRVLVKMLSASAVLPLLFASAAMAQEVVDQSNVEHGGGWSTVIYNEESVGQTYIAGETGYLNRIDVYVQDLCTLDPNKPIVATIIESNVLQEPVSYSDVTLSYKSDTTSCDPMWISLKADQPILQVTGREYTFLVQPTENMSRAPHISLEVSGANTYGNDYQTHLWRYIPAINDQWMGYGNNDLLFQTYVTPDTVAPTGTILINNGAARTTTRLVTLNLSATDPEPSSGVTEMRFKNGGADTVWTAWEPYAETKSWRLTSGEGKKRVGVQFRDAAGNRSAKVYDYIIFRR